MSILVLFFFFFQAEDGIRDSSVTGVQTCALPISFAGEIRFGEVEVEMFAEEVGFAVPLGRVAVTECQSINQFRGTATQAPRFTRGYGLAFGQSERKAMAMALVDRALRARELGEESKAPAQDEEFVLS